MFTHHFKTLTIVLVLILHSSVASAVSSDSIPVNLHRKVTPVLGSNLKPHRAPSNNTPSINVYFVESSCSLVFEGLEPATVSYMLYNNLGQIVAQGDFVGLYSCADVSDIIAGEYELVVNVDGIDYAGELFIR